MDRPTQALLALTLTCVAGHVRADMPPPPPPQCTGALAGASCSARGEPGVCAPAECGAQIRHTTVVRGESECLACTLPPDPAVQDATPAAAVAAAVAPASPWLSWAILAGTLALAALVLVVPMVRRGRRGPTSPGGSP